MRPGRIIEYQEDIVKGRQVSVSKTSFLLFGTLCLCLSVIGGQANAANVNVGVNVALPPLFRIAAPPPVVVVPGTYVYAVPDVAVDIFFFRNAWYRPHEGNWFRASSYNGPWRYLLPHQVPRGLRELPHYDYRRIPPGYQRIPYGQVKKNWSRWERNQHWERDVVWHKGWKGHEDRDRRGWDGDRGYGRDSNGPRGPIGRDERPRGFEPGGPGGGPDRGPDGYNGHHGR